MTISNVSSRRRFGRISASLLIALGGRRDVWHDSRWFPPFAQGGCCYSQEFVHLSPRQRGSPRRVNTANLRFGKIRRARGTGSRPCPRGGVGRASRFAGAGPPARL